MHVKAKDMAVLAMLAAVSMIFMLLGNVIESNTLFFYAGAACLAGVAIRKYNTYSGCLMAAVCLVLSFFLLPNKLYAGTYFALVLYVVIWEVCEQKRVNIAISFLIKYVVFNAFYVPILIFFPSLIIGKEMGTGFFVLCLVLGQVVLLVFDIAYKKVMPVLMTWVRKVGNGN